MSTTVSAGPGVRISAPLPPPRKYTLLDAATRITTENDRWTGGANIEGYPPGPAAVHVPCSTGTYAVKDEGGDSYNPHAEAFTAYLAGICTARSIGAVPDSYRQRLELVFQSVETKAVENVLATGGGFAELFLGDANMELLAAAAVGPTEGLALLENEIATVGAGIIHATPGTATAWAALSLIAPVRGVMQTVANGTPVAVGAGYIGAQPLGEAAPGADSEWAFASGPVGYIRDEAVRTIPGDYSQALDRTVNEVVFISERDYLLVWVGRADTSDESRIQAGVLIDRST